MKHFAQKFAAQGLSIPEDVVYGDFFVSMIGNHTIVVENYKKIISYDPQCIIVEGKHKDLHIMGQHLVIQYYSVELMKIKGTILKLEYA